MNAPATLDIISQSEGTRAGKKICKNSRKVLNKTPPNKAIKSLITEDRETVALASRKPSGIYILTLAKISV